MDEIHSPEKADPFKDRLFLIFHWFLLTKTMYLNYTANSFRRET